MLLENGAAALKTSLLQELDDVRFDTEVGICLKTDDEWFDLALI